MRKSPWGWLIGGLAVLAFMLGGCGKQVPFRSNAELDGLKGPVKSYTLTHYDVGPDGNMPREEAVKNFTEKGFISSSTTKDLRRGRALEVSYEFGSEGLPTSSTRRDPQSGESTRMEMSYDLEAKSSVIRQFDEDGKLLFRLDRQYDDAGWYKTDKVTDGDGELMQEVHYFRDGKGLLTQEETYMGGRQEPVSVARYEYDEDGIMMAMKQTAYGGKETRFTFEYEWDDRGNWIARDIKQDGAPHSRDERTLAYY